MQSIQVLFEIPQDEYHYWHGLWARAGFNVDVVYKLALEGEDGVWRAGFRFSTVSAYRYTTAYRCSAWHVEAYQQLVEVHDSEWIRELQGQQIANGLGDLRREMHHYMLYFDEEGAYEVVAADWSRLLPALGAFPDPANGVDFRMESIMLYESHEKSTRGSDAD